MKKTVRVIGIALLSLLVLASFVACDKEPAAEPEHVHSWDEGEITKSPTCEAKGEKTFTCTSCGEKRTEELAIVNHNISAETFQCSFCKNYFFSSVAKLNEKAKRADLKGKTVSVVVGEQGFKENTYWESNSGLGTDVKSLLIGNTDLNKYGAEALTDAERVTFVFCDGKITSDATGYTDINTHSDDQIFMLLPANSDVVFENITFNGVIYFNIQMYTQGWKVLNSLTFKDCTFNGLIIGTCPADEIVFDGCTFNNYTNTTKANNSNPIWMSPKIGSWDATNPHVGMNSIVFKNNTVTSSRPVKFEEIGYPYKENGADVYYNVKITILDNYFDISKENTANESGKLKNDGLYLYPQNSSVKFTLVDDGNTMSEGTNAIYTFGTYDSSSTLATSGIKVCDRNGQPKTVEYVTWKTSTVNQLSSSAE